MERTQLLVVVYVACYNIQPHLIEALSWPGWIKTILELRITSWKSDTLDGQEIAGILREGGIPADQNEFRNQQSHGARTLDCAST